MSSSKFLKELIAGKHGITPQEVTVGFIAEQYRQHPFPLDPEDIKAIEERGLVYISDEQFKKEESQFDAFLGQF